MDQMVSIVIPIYKVEAYLRKCIDSLLSQNYPNIEIVLVDDGSPDNCPAIADEYAQRFSNVTTYHKPNGGLGDARNYGVRHAKGEWIAFVDSDDYVSKTYISDMVGLVERFHADMAITNIVRRIEGEKVREGVYFNEFAVDAMTAIEDMYIRRHVGWEAVGKLFPKSYLLNVPFPAGYYEDCACMYKIVEQCSCVAIGDYSLNYGYVSRGGSILQSELKPEHYHIFNICSEFASYYKNSKGEMDTKTVIFHQRAILQLLRCQKMKYSKMREIFYRFKKIFHHNCLKIQTDRSVPVKAKVYNLLLCTTPECFLFFQKVLMLFRRKNLG